MSFHFWGNSFNTKKENLTTYLTTYEIWNRSYPGKSSCRFSKKMKNTWELRQNIDIFET